MPERLALRITIVRDLRPDTSRMLRPDPVVERDLTETWHYRFFEPAGFPGRPGVGGERMRLRSTPQDRVGQYPLYLGLMIDRVLLMSGAEIENPAQAPGPAHSAAHDFATGE